MLVISIGPLKGPINPANAPFTISENILGCQAFLFTDLLTEIP